MRGSNHTSSGLSDVNGWKHESRVKLSSMVFTTLQPRMSCQDPRTPNQSRAQSWSHGAQIHTLNRILSDGRVQWKIDTTDLWSGVLVWGL